jgi:effector-binding domain-containing protein
MMQGAPVLGTPRTRDFSGQATLIVKTVTRIGPQLSKAIKACMGPVYALLKARGLPVPGHNVVSYGLFLPDGSIPIECGVLTPEPMVGSESVVPSALPAGRVAVLSHLGPYYEMSRTYDAIKAWCEATGLEQSGPAWEEYDDWSDDPAKLRTDVYRLLR